MSGTVRVRLVRSVLAALLGLGILATWAGPASAHATVESSTPSDGQRLTAAPDQVSILFSEPVTSDLGGLRVVDASGQRVDDGQTQGSGTSTLKIGLKSGLGDNTYVITYRVVSADSHPVKGSVVFTVGAGATADVRGLVGSGGGGERGFELLGWASRFCAYAGGLAAAGLAFFVFFIFDGGPEAPLLARLTRIGAFVGIVGGLGTAAAQAALATGRGWAGVFDLGVLHTVLTKNLDWATVVLIAGLVVVLAALEVRSPTAQRALAFYGGLATVLSFVMTGHPDEAAHRWLAILSDAVHVSTAAIWFGGLVGLTAVLVLRGRVVARAGDGTADDGPADSLDDDGAGTPLTPASAGGVATMAPALTPELAPAPNPALVAVRGAATVVSRFSTTAFVSVLALWAAGVTLAWIELGSRQALTGTTYGRLILVKVAIVLVVAVAAAYNRFTLVPTILDEVDQAEAPPEAAEAAEAPGAADASPDDSGHAATTTTAGEADDGDQADPREHLTLARRALRHLRTSVAFEVMAIVVVLGVTAALVNTPPGTTATATASVFDETQPIATSTPGTTVNLVVSPGKGGQRAIHISYYDASRKPFAVSGPVSVELSLPADQIGPIKRETDNAGPGHFIIDSIQISPTGTWQIDVVTRLGDFDQQRNRFTVPIS